MDGWSTTEEHVFQNDSIAIDFELHYLDDPFEGQESIMDALPVEILEHIFAYLDLLHVCRISQVKKIFKELSNSNAIWLSLFKQRFNSIRDKNFLETNADPIDYKDVLLTYEYCFIEVNNLISTLNPSSLSDEHFRAIKAIIDKYPGVAVRILVDLEVHHIVFRYLKTSADMVIEFIELLITDDRNKIIMENYGLMNYLFECQDWPRLEHEYRKRAVNVMLDLPLRDLNDHHGDKCSICSRSPILGSLLYASESSNFTKKFCGQCYFEAPNEEYLVLRANNFMKHPTTGLRQATNDPITKVHYTSCSNCEAYPIYGAVYRCMICSQHRRNCDLCAHCRALHPQNHTFLELRKKRENYFSASRSELLQADLISKDVDYNFNDEYMKEWMIPPLEVHFNADSSSWTGFLVRRTRLMKVVAYVYFEFHTLHLKCNDYDVSVNMQDETSWLAPDGIRGYLDIDDCTFCYHIWPISDAANDE